MGNFNYKKYLSEGKLNEALAPQDVVDIADTVAEEFTKESADEGDFLIYTVGRMEGESFELDTETTAQTPDSVDPIGVGEGWGGNFSIRSKGEGYEVRNGEKGGLVAIIDSMGNFKMLSAAESRAEMGMTDGERTDYMERRRETSDYMQEVLGQIKETLDDEAFDMAEKIIDSLGAEKAVGELVRAMSTDDAKLYLGGIIRDYDLKEEMDQDDNEFLQFTDMDKPAATETKYYEDKVDEKIKEKPSTNNKMKKSELKEMIKAAMMFEAEDSKKGNKEEQERMEGAIRDDRDHIKDLEKDIKDNEEKLAKLKKDFKDDVNEEKVDEGSKYYEEKVDEAEDVEVEDNEDIDVDIEKDVDVKVDDEESEVDVDIKASMPGESEDVEEVQALLMKAQEAASDLGDEKLMDQIGNTITYFTRSQVARVDEMDDLDVNLNTTEMEAEMGLEETKDNMDEEVKGDIKEEVKENLNESIFPMWNKIK